MYSRWKVHSNTLSSLIHHLTRQRHSGSCTGRGGDGEGKKGEKRKMCVCVYVCVCVCVRERERERERELENRELTSVHKYSSSH